jgi:glycerophosphoryl diester phosphodiesterase
MRNLRLNRLAAFSALVFGLCAAPVCAVTVIAHRGDSAHFPENTHSAFQSAVEKKADLVELDAHATQDGVLVVIHDSTLDRTTYVDEISGVTDLQVADQNWDWIKSLDAGSWKSPDFSGERISTLEECLEAIQQGSVTLLERKAGSALAYAKLLERMNLTEDLIVQAFDWDFLAALRTWAPKVRLGALGGKDLTQEILEDLEKADISLVVWRHSDVDVNTMELVKARGMEMWCYTINEAPEWKRLIDLGVTGIITDKPGELREWLKQEGYEQ